MKKVLIVASTSGFIKGFLLSDAKMLQELGYEVHCAANHKAMVTFKAEELFPKYNIIFHKKRYWLFSQYLFVDFNGGDDSQKSYPRLYF